MPILSREPNLHPGSLFETPQATDGQWWAMYTLPRQEKKLMRRLFDEDVPYYSPIIKRRYRSAGGRLRTTFTPLFGSYVFVCGGETERYQAVSTGCVSRWLPVGDTMQFVADLRQLQQLIVDDFPLSPERRLEPGQRVRIRNGAFAGYEGVILRREREVRLQVAVRFMDQGVSVLLDDCQADPI
ncbi:MAG: UpxY family transcription antiterminator [Pirellulaceae bacterium]|nr:UpxY family transcription antiterminator [Pirellulaceae bacterium]